MKKLLVLLAITTICFSAEAKNSIVKNVLKINNTMQKVEKPNTVDEANCTVYGQVQAPGGEIFTSHETASTCEKAWQKMVDRMIALEAAWGN